MCPIAILCKEHIKSFKQNLIIVIFKAIRIDFRKALHNIYRAICNSGYSGGGGRGQRDCGLLEYTNLYKIFSYSLLL